MAEEKDQTYFLDWYEDMMDRFGGGRRTSMPKHHSAPLDLLPGTIVGSGTPDYVVAKAIEVDGAKVRARVMYVDGAIGTREWEADAGAVIPVLDGAKGSPAATD